MFTGIVEELGRVRNVSSVGGLLELEVGCCGVLDDLQGGESVSINGCCQTVTRIDETGFFVQVMPKSLEMTTLGSLEPGATVNLERAMRAGGRLGGHWVQGHVDGIGEVIEVRSSDGDHRVRVRSPESVSRYLVSRGSITVDGASLTVAEMGDDEFEVALIPTTLRETIADGYERGTRVNLEADILARYLEKLVTNTQLSWRGENR